MLLRASKTNRGDDLDMSGIDGELISQTFEIWIGTNKQMLRGLEISTAHRRFKFHVRTHSILALARNMIRVRGPWSRCPSFESLPPPLHVA